MLQYSLDINKYEIQVFIWILGMNWINVQKTIWIGLNQVLFILNTLAVVIHPRYSSYILLSRLSLVLNVSLVTALLPSVSFDNDNSVIEWPWLGSYGAALDYQEGQHQCP